MKWVCGGKALKVPGILCFEQSFLKDFKLQLFGPDVQCQPSCGLAGIFMTAQHHNNYNSYHLNPTLQLI